MRRLTYENARGEKIVFYLSPLLITSLTGIGEVDAEVQSQKAPYQDGDTYIDAILDPRFINLEGVITEKDLTKIREYRREISRICNPKLGLGLITLELDGDIKQIMGTLDGGVVFPDRGQEVWQRFMITWKCPNPYWEDVKPTIEDMAVFVGRFEFPLEIQHDIGMEFGEQGEKVVINNPGDAEAPVQIEFNGPAVNPKVTNLTTGEYLMVNRTIAVEERLVLDTSFGEKRVEIHKENGEVENAFHWIDLGSTFWQLQLGDNEIQYEADVGMDVARVYITRKNRYVGI